MRLFNTITDTTTSAHQSTTRPFLRYHAVEDENYPSPPRKHANTSLQLISTPRETHVHTIASTISDTDVTEPTTTMILRCVCVCVWWFRATLCKHKSRPRRRARKHVLLLSHSKLLQWTIRHIEFHSSRALLCLWWWISMVFRLNSRAVNNVKCFDDNPSDNDTHLSSPFSYTMFSTRSKLINVRNVRVLSLTSLFFSYTKRFLLQQNQYFKKNIFTKVTTHHITKIGNLEM